MRYRSLPRSALLGLLALAACGQSSSPPVAVAGSPGARLSLGASATGVVRALQGTVSAGPTCPVPCRQPTSPPGTVAVSPRATPSLGASAAGVVTGLQGTVSAGPTCPVERVGSPCPP